jgi:hypothetical protein
MAAFDHSSRVEGNINFGQVIKLKKSSFLPQEECLGK